MSKEDLDIVYDHNLKLSTETIHDVTIQHNPYQFLLELGQDIPLVEMGQEVKLIKKTVGRFSLSPIFAKLLRNVLDDNIKNYESKFGEIIIS
jgi:hypothetical protein